jgi:hypothetical protein
MNNYRLMITRTKPYGKDSWGELMVVNQDTHVQNDRNWESKVAVPCKDSVKGD